MDGVGDITDPLGLSGSRLEVQSVIVDAFSPHVKSLIRSVELAGGEISGLVFGPLVAARAALSKRQKDLGVVLVDIGFGTTGMSVYEENKLIGVAKFPIGAGNISNDLGIGLKIPIDAAEEIKLEYGNAVRERSEFKGPVDITKFVPEAKGPISRRFIAEIIESRMEEIFDLVNAELKLSGNTRASRRRGHRGRRRETSWRTDLAKQEMRLSAQIGSTLAGEWVDEGGTFKEYLEDPEFVGALGLVLWGADNAGWEGWDPQVPRCAASRAFSGTLHRKGRITWAACQVICTQEIFQKNPAILSSMKKKKSMVRARHRFR